MSGYDYERPFVSQGSLPAYRAADAEAAAGYGDIVKATELSNVEYKIRFGRLARENRMKPPSSCGRIFMGYLVIRNLGTSRQYETWMPDHVFEEIYQPTVQAKADARGTQ